MASNEYNTIGFIGLGTMGYPMCENLIKKCSETTKFFVYDVSRPSVDRLCKSYVNRVTPCNSSKEVAEQAVCMGICSMSTGDHD